MEQEGHEGVCSLPGSGSCGCVHVNVCLGVQFYVLPAIFFFFFLRLKLLKPASSENSGKGSELL